VAEGEQAAHGEQDAGVDGGKRHTLVLLGLVRAPRGAIIPRQPAARTPAGRRIASDRRRLDARVPLFQAQEGPLEIPIGHGRDSQGQ
jgi:hypothetical protein